MYTEKIALIDIGSNTIRLVIYGIDQTHHFVELHNEKIPARLSQYLDQKKGQVILNKDGLNVLIEILHNYHQVCQEFKVDTILPKATAAIRQSSNQADIIDTVKTVTGLTIEIVTEEEEAKSGAYAITHSMDIDNALTIDIGGGSCEITLFEDKKVVQYHSFPFGTVSLQKDFFANKDHNDSQAMSNLSNFVKKAFRDYDWIKKAKVPVIAIGGSARNVANVFQRSIDYPMAGLHGFVMTKDQLDQTLQLFANTPFDKMNDIDGLSSDRLDIIIPANLVFIELVKAAKSDAFVISTRGLREGMVLKYINDNYDGPIDNATIRARAIFQMKEDLPMAGIGPQTAVDTSISLYSQLCHLGLLEYNYKLQELLEYAASIYRFGGFLSAEADSQHTFYICANMNLLGFVHKDRLKLALLASYRNKSLFKQYLSNYQGWLAEDEKKNYRF